MTGTRGLHMPVYFVSACFLLWIPSIIVVAVGVEFAKLVFPFGRFEFQTPALEDFMAIGAAVAVFATAMLLLGERLGRRDAVKYLERAEAGEDEPG